MLRELGLACRDRLADVFHDSWIVEDEMPKRFGVDFKKL